MFHPFLQILAFLG